MTGHCCCVVFRDETGQYRIQRHACCSQHWKDADDDR